LRHSCWQLVAELSAVELELEVASQLFVDQSHSLLRVLVSQHFVPALEQRPLAGVSPTTIDQLSGLHNMFYHSTDPATRPIRRAVFELELRPTIGNEEVR
jgi:hypothetical protein